MPSMGGLQPRLPVKDKFCRVAPALAKRVTPRVASAGKGWIVRLDLEMQMWRRSHVAHRADHLALRDARKRCGKYSQICFHHVTVDAVNQAAVVHHMFEDDHTA